MTKCALTPAPTQPGRVGIAHRIPNRTPSEKIGGRCPPYLTTGITSSHEVVLDGLQLDGNLAAPKRTKRLGPLILRRGKKHSSVCGPAIRRPWSSLRKTIVLPSFRSTW